MSDSDSNNSETPRRNDPRLKAFLRQARGVISMERGLNQKSQLKLQSLAENLKLPNELFQIAIEELKNAQKPSEVSHWERGFITFLDRELGKFKKNLMTIKMQNRALEIAKKKFQLSEIRALQLIGERAEANGISRISVEEANRFVREMVADRIGAATAIAKEVREQLYKSALNWGLEEEQADKLIGVYLSNNQSLARRKKTIKISVASLALAVIGGVAFAAVQYDWVNQLKKMLQPDFVAINDPLPEKDSPFVDKPLAPPTTTWLDLNLQQRVSRARETMPRMREGLSKLENSNPDQRVLGYQDVFDVLCSQEFAEDEFELLVADILFRDPDESCTQQAIEHLGSYLEVKTDTLVINMNRIDRAFRANAMLVMLGFYVPNEAAPSTPTRQQQVLRQVTRSLDKEIDVSDPKLFLERSEASLAAESWNHLVQNCWSSPSRFAAHVQPLYELTKNKMERTLANQFRQRAINAILDVDPSRWRDLQVPIRKAIEFSDNTRVNEWIRSFLSVENRDYADFLAKELLIRTKLEPHSSERSVVRRALTDYRMTFQRKKLEPLLTRNNRVTRLVFQAENFAADFEKPASPEAIAKLAFATNLSLAIVNIANQRQRSFDFFDSNFSMELPVLRDEVPLDFRQSTDLTPSNSTASASENRRKSELIDKLSSFSEMSLSARMTVVEQLAELASRFQQISYLEAKVISEYILSEMDIEEWLNIERHIDSFKPWPNFSLALADQLPDSNVQLDQGVTIFRLLFPGEFQLETPDDWRNELSRRIRVEVLEEMNQRQPHGNPESVQWERLNKYLDKLYSQRRRLLSDLFPAAMPTSTIEESIGSVSCLKVLMADQGLSRSARERTKRLIALIQDSEQSELTKTIMANHVLFELLAEKTSSKFPSAIDDVAQLRLELASQASGVANGKRLELVELQLLRLVDVYRTESIDALYWQN